MTTREIAPGFFEGGAPAPAVAAILTVSMRQARLALLAEGLLDDVEAAIDAIPDAAERAAARITWDFAAEVRRDWPLLLQLSAALGLSSAQVDALFAAAAAIPVA